MTDIGHNTDKWYYNRNVLIVLFFAIGFLPVFVAKGGFLINCDSTTQLIPFVMETKRLLASGIPWWSWNTYFGDNFVGSYAYYTLTSPFMWITCLFPNKYLGIGFALCLCLKFLVGGYFSSLYLRKMGFDRKLCLVGSLLYVFCAWGITNTFYYIFVEPFIFYPFLLLFIERYLRGQRHRYSGLIMASAVVAFINYYFIPCTFIAATIYYFIRQAYLPGSVRAKTFATLKALGCVAFAFVMISVVLVPVYCQLEGTSRSMIVLRNTFGFWAERFQTLFLPKYTEGVFGFILLGSNTQSNAATVAVFGSLPLWLMIFRKKWTWLSWLSIVYVVLYVTVLNAIFSLLTGGPYTRWAYAVAITIVLATLTYLREHGTIKRRYLNIYSIFSICLYLMLLVPTYLWMLKHGDLNSVRQWRILCLGALLVVNIACLYWVCAVPYSDPRWFRRCLTAIGICAVCQMQLYSLTEIADSPLSTFTEATESRYVNDLDQRASSDSVMCRVDFVDRGCLGKMEENGYRASNLALLFNRPSVETFNSVQNSGYRLLLDAAIPDQKYTYIDFYPQVNRRSFDALMSVRYVYRVDDVPSFQDVDLPDWEPVAEVNGITGYDFEPFIPFGYTYDSYITIAEMEPLLERSAEVDNPLVMLNHLVIDREDEPELSKYLTHGDITEISSLDSVAQRRIAGNVCREFVGNTRGFTADVEMDCENIVFFSVPALRGFTAKIDGAETKIYTVNVSLMGIVVPAGKHHIDVSFFPPGLKLGAIISLIALVLLIVLYFAENRLAKK